MRNRVVCYITRSKHELLVLSRADWKRPGVVAGSVEAGETYEPAAVREVWEESGLELKSPTYLGSFVRELPPEFNGLQHNWHQHYVWLEALQYTPDRWTHQVSAGEDDQALLHDLAFVPIRNHQLSDTLEHFLPKLEEYL